MTDPDLPAVKMTASVRAVLVVLARASGAKLDVREIVRRAGRSPATVRQVLNQLQNARLVQSLDQTGVPDRPPHRVWWLTPDGTQVTTPYVYPPDSPVTTHQ